MRPFLVCVLLSATGGLPAQEARMAGEGRLRPPQGIACERDQLTSYSGRVTGYKPGAASTWIEIHTDEDTVEAITLEHAGRPDASARYLLRGEAFTAKDRAKIESAPGTLRRGMRAVAWVCLDGKTPPLLDWQPPPA